jgi:uncharacterized membrane protein YdbT with pleckstrin-like domain
MTSYDALHLDEGENVILEVRKHWIVFVVNIIGFFVLASVPVIIYGALLNYFTQYGQFFSGIYFSLFLFVYLLWFLFLWIGFFLSWTKFFLDVWYVTGSRIIDIEQQRIFHRDISNLRFDKIQDITIEVNGFLATMLNYGNIRVQTASENEKDFYMQSVKDPDNVKRIIFAQHNIVGNRIDDVKNQAL